ncbi:MAG: sn-glycerol-3-phosphate ABC transporter permease UgpA [Candidatus Neomarinimicrobiota bacterium]
MEKRVVFRHPVLPYILVAPQIVITLVFFIWPASQALFQSLLRQDPFGLSTEFIWFENFKELFSTPAYMDSMKVTAVFSFCVAILALAAALYLAVQADRVIRGGMAYKTLLIWPYAVAPAVAGVLWMFMFSPTLGIISYMLQLLGYDWNHRLNGNEAMALVVAASSWRQVSYNFLFFLAGMFAIPKSLIEASAIDGAGPARRFWTIVFPLLMPTTFFLLVMNMIYAFFDTFGVIDMISQGGPAGATRIMVYRVFEDGFRAMDLGGSSSQSVVLMAIVIVLTVVQFRYIERKVEY